MTGPLLVIDAATSRGSVAIVHGTAVLAEGDVQMRGAHEERLMPAVAEALRSAGVGLGALSGVVCGEGPGSFTSLRIAASIGKGIATAAGLPLYSVSSLLLIVVGSGSGMAGRYLATLDAMRGDVFASRVSVGSDGSVSIDGDVALTTAAAAATAADAEKRSLVGPGSSPAWWPHARGVARLAGTPVAPQPVDLALWEPAYGRLAEAQVAWEQRHGRRLSV